MTDTLTRRRRRIAWWVWPVAVIALAIGVIAGLGGFGETRVERVPTLALGDVYAGLEVDSSIEGSELATAQGTVQADPGTTLLTVRVQATSHADDPIPYRAVDIGVRLDGVLTVLDPADHVLRETDGEEMGLLQPGVPTILLFVWQVPDDVSERDDVTFGIFEATPTNDVLSPDGYGRPEPARRLPTTIGAHS